MKYLKVYTDFAEDIRELTDNEVGRLFRAMLLYAETETVSGLKGNERYLWWAAKKNIDAQRNSYEERCSTNKRIATNRYQTSPDVTKRNDSCEEQEQEQKQEQEQEQKTEKKSTVVRHAYGVYGWVKLSGAEHDRLLSDLGEAELSRCINLVDERAQGTGNKNKWRDWNLIVRRCHRENWGRNQSGKESYANESRNDENLRRKWGIQYDNEE